MNFGVGGFIICLISNDFNHTNSTTRHKEDRMKQKLPVLFILVLAVALALPVPGYADKVKLDPGRAPSKGPADAPVTIIEIADFM